MGFDSWSLRDKVVMIWGLIIASVALVFVGVSLGNLISENSSNIASWVQAIGSIAAILGVWWQTKTQISAEKTRRREEEVQKARANLRRSSYLLKSVQAVCVQIRKFHLATQEQIKLHAWSRSQQHTMKVDTWSTDSDFLKPNYEQYYQALASIFVLFEGFPYWEIEDTEIATGFLSINQSARICLLVLKHDPGHFLETMSKFLDEMEKIIDEVERKETRTLSQGVKRRSS